jgi:hypothetical protein
VGAIPVAYGDDLAERLRKVVPSGIDAFIDTYGNGYVDLAVELGVDPSRIDTIIRLRGRAKAGAKAEGSSTASDAEILAFVAEEVAWGRVAAPDRRDLPAGGGPRGVHRAGGPATPAARSCCPRSCRRTRAVSRRRLTLQTFDPLDQRGQLGRTRRAARSGAAAFAWA